MQYFTKEATITYLTLTEVSFNNYLISRENYRERLHLLRQFCNPDEKDTIANIEILISDLIEWERSTNKTEYEYIDIEQKAERTAESDISSNTEISGDNFDPSLHFISAKTGKISKWNFHKADDDYFPSIPHGHAIVNDKIKLDAYRGYIYKNGTESDREKRQFIIDLWNDNKFREAARETICYYMKKFPNYHWRVPNPKRLPRRR
jgi:hypothetical protein